MEELMEVMSMYDRMSEALLMAEYARRRMG